MKEAQLIEQTNGRWLVIVKFWRTKEPKVVSVEFTDLTNALAYMGNEINDGGITVNRR